MQLSAELLAQKLREAKAFEPLLPAKEYPQGYLAPFEDRLVAMASREPYILEHGYVLLSKECLDALVAMLKGRRVADLGSGGGFLSHCLEERGIDATAVERCPPSAEPTDDDPRRHWKVDHVGCALDFDTSSFDVIVLSWPELGTPFAASVAAKLKPGQILLYQGEYYGCTADADFFELLEGPGWLAMPDETKALNAHHVQFPGIRDRWAVIQRVSESTQTAPKKNRQL